jgi:TonB family protein
VLEARTLVGPWAVVQRDHGCAVVDTTKSSDPNLPAYWRPFRGEAVINIPTDGYTRTGLNLHAPTDGLLRMAGKAYRIRGGLVLVLEPGEPGTAASQFMVVTLGKQAQQLFSDSPVGGGRVQVEFRGRTEGSALFPPAAVWQETDRCLQHVGEALLTASPPPQHDGSPVPRDVPVPRQAPSQWIDAESYPASAIKAKAQGDTGVRVEVDRYGYPTSCRVVKSAGFKALDDAACPQIMKRGRFYPALDANGVAVAGVWERKVIWRL